MSILLAQLTPLRDDCSLFLVNIPLYPFLFERSEFLIDTSPKKSLPVCTRARVHACSTNLGFSVLYYVPHTYVSGISSLSARYQDTYMYLRMCQGGVRIVCHICS